MGYRGRIAPLDMIEFDDPALPAGAAGMQLRLNIPISGSFGQLGLYILAFEKQGFGALAYQRLHEADELV
jgi:hypothetical protein